MSDKFGQGAGGLGIPITAHLPRGRDRPGRGDDIDRALDQ
jgi:hypothetical protein